MARGFPDQMEDSNHSSPFPGVAVPSPLLWKGLFGHGSLAGRASEPRTPWYHREKALRLSCLGFLVAHGNGALLPFQPALHPVRYSRCPATHRLLAVSEARLLGIQERQRVPTQPCWEYSSFSPSELTFLRTRVLAP